MCWLAPLRALVRRHARDLRGDQSGVAAVEFGLWTTMFFFGIMAAIDFGVFYVERSKVSEAIGAGAVSSFSSADNVNFAQMPDYVKALAEDPNLTVALSCNGAANSCTNFSRSCACLKTDGSYVANACGTSCTGTGVTSGSTAGYYLTITATQNYTPVMLPHSVLADKDFSQQATVRLQ